MSTFPALFRGAPSARKAGDATKALHAMTLWAAESHRRVLVAWVDLVRRGAVAVVIAAALVAAATGAYVVHAFRINTDTEDMLSPELPFRQHSRALSEAFPQFSDNIVVVIDADSADLADDAAERLAVRLRERPNLFGSVFDPRGGPFFRRNGLLFLETDALNDLADRLADAQPFLGTLWRDPSLRGLFDILSLAMDESVAGDGGAPMGVADVVASVADVVEAEAEGRFRLLSWRALMTGTRGNAADRRRVILIQPRLDFGSLRPAESAMTALRALITEMVYDGAAGVNVRLTGSAALAEEELESVEEGMGLAAILSLFLVAVLLSVGLGSPRLTIATVLTLVCGLIMTAAFAFAVVGELNLISVAFAVLFIGLSVDFGIHFVLRYREALIGGRTQDAALGEAAAGVGGALTLCTVAASIGFFSFLPTDYRGLAELGLIAGVGMFVALAANLTILPALITLMGSPAPPPAARAGAPARLARAIENHPRAVIASALALTLAAGLLAPWARFDFDPLNLKDRRTESVSTLFDLMADSRTSPYSATVLAPSLDAADALARRLSSLDPVESTATLSDYVPAAQTEKLEIIDAMSFFLAPALSNRYAKPPPGPDERAAALTRVRERLAAFAATSRDAASRAAAERLSRAFDRLEAKGGTDGDALASLERRLIALFSERIRELGDSLAAEPFARADLPDEIKRRAVAADGRARLEIYPKENLHDREALERFVSAVRAVAPDAIGSPVVILEAGNTVVGAVRDAAVLAFVVIAILMGVLLRSVRDALFVFAPLVVAAVLTVAASVLLRLPFDFANVIVLPLLFGLGVANGVHLVVRGREDSVAGAVMGTSTPRAVVFSALTTVGSFGTIALSSHPGTAGMGVLLTISIGFTLVASLTVLPALMRLTWERRERVPR